MNQHFLRDGISVWWRFVFAIFIILFAAILRVWPMQELGSSLAWLTFYPAVMLVAIFGGLYPGLVATTFACLIVEYFWSFLVKEPFIRHSADYLGMMVFVLTGVVISVLSETLHRSRTQEQVYHTLINSMDAGFCVVEMIYDRNSKPVDYRFVEINPAFQKQTGLNDALTKTIREMVPNHDEHWFEIYGEVAKTGESIRFENPAIAMKRYYDVFAFRIGSNGSNKVGLLFSDISEKKRSEMLLREAMSLNENILQSSDIGIAAYNQDGHCMMVNPAFAKMIGAREDQALKQNFKNLQSWKTSGMLEWAASVLQTGQLEAHDIEITTSFGRHWWLHFKMSRFMSGAVPHLLLMATDTSMQKRTEEELRIAAAAFETNDVIVITDAKADILRVNRAFTRVTGFSQEEVIGKNPHILSAGLHDKEFYEAMWQRLLNEGTWEGEIWDKRKNGEIYPRWMSITAVKNERHETTRYVAISSDITERKKHEEFIQGLAFIDALTQLPNRRMLDDRLGQAIVASKRRSIYGAVLFIDLDNFKPLNDNHGHAAGDSLLVEASNRLKHSVREMDTVARFGGDEFVVMLQELMVDEKTSINQAMVIAEKIQKSLSAPYRLTFVQNGVDAVVEHTCTASIGVALFGDSCSGRDEVLKLADAAMYQAKQMGRNQIRLNEIQC